MSVVRVLYASHCAFSFITYKISVKQALIISLFNKGRHESPEKLCNLPILKELSKKKFSL